MLDSMRGLAKSYVAKALMFFLVLSFAVWGMGDIVRGGADSYVAKVGDEKITPNQFIGETRSMQRALESMGVANVDARALQGEILRRLIQQQLLRQWQKDSGLAVSRESLAEAIARSPEFQNADGQFDPQQFRFMLAQRQLNEAGYLALLRDELGGKFMMASLEMRDVALPESVQQQILAASTQRRDAVIFTVRPKAVSPASISTADVESYYALNAERYQTPERRTVEYVLLDKNGLDATLDAMQKDEALQLSSREEALQELAMQIEDGLAGGSSMGEAVAGTGIAAQSHVLKSITAAQFAAKPETLQAQIAEHGFALGEDETSGLKMTESGAYYVVTVKEVQPPAPRPLKEVEKDVRAAVAKQQARIETKARLQTLKTALTDGGDWKKAAASVQARTSTLRNLARPATLPDGSLKESGTIPASLQQAVFEYSVNGVAGPAMRDNGDLLLALVTDIRSQPGKTDAKTKTALAQTSQQQLEDSILNSTMRELASRYEVRVNEPLLMQLQQGDAANE